MADSKDKSVTCNNRPPSFAQHLRLVLPPVLALSIHRYFSDDFILGGNMLGAVPSIVAVVVVAYLFWFRGYAKS
jgi:hypothetical protein